MEMTKQHVTLYIHVYNILLCSAKIMNMSVREHGTGIVNRFTY